MSFNSGSFHLLKSLGVFTLLMTSKCAHSDEAALTESSYPESALLEESLTSETPQAPTAKVSLSMRARQKNRFDVELWRSEHDQIQEIRINRYRPTEPGMWYSSQSKEEKRGRTFSDGQYPLVMMQLGYLAISGKDGRNAAMRGLSSLAVTGAVTIGVKKTFRRRRPYPNDNQFGTFPSGHTSTTFAMAGIFGAAQPKMKVPALLAAGMVGWSRVKVRAHHWQDVLAGAALGMVVSNQFKPDREVRGPLANINLPF